MVSRQVLRKGSFPTVQSLVEILSQHTIPFAGWGTSSGTKSVDQLYGEIIAGETVLEQESLVQNNDSTVVAVSLDSTQSEQSDTATVASTTATDGKSVVPSNTALMRVVHVACVKVRRKEEVQSVEVVPNGDGNWPITKVQGRDRWLVEERQRFPDGRERTRGSLLSEKMMSGENETWQLAAIRGIQEELGSLVESASQVELVEESYYKVEETEDSHSYPGLMSKYILHNVEALVTELPGESFSTTETNTDGSLRLESFWTWVEPSTTQRSVNEQS